jgi:integrase
VCLLIDSGARIDEALTAQVSNVDLDQMIIKVRGKGNKERMIPISIEMRKILWLYLNRHRFKVGDYLFPTRDGRRLGSHTPKIDLSSRNGGMAQDSG